MNRFEHYLSLKEQYKGVADGELKQYLHIVQVMAEEETSWNNHRRRLDIWLSNIERLMKVKAREVKENDR